MFIGITGLNGAGKGAIAEYLKSRGFGCISLSDMLREEADRRKIERTRENLIAIGNELREKEGPAVLAKRAVQKITFNRLDGVVIDSIRNPAEITELKNSLRGFHLICVEAKSEIRFKRVFERQRENDPRTFRDFLKKDNADRGAGQKNTGQQLQRCIDLAKIVVRNNSTLPELHDKLDRMLDDLLNKCPRPSWDEYFIGLSREVAKRATCDRGKSGCIIVKDKRVLTTGYVGSPIGQPHCDEAGHLMHDVIREDGTVTKHCVRTVHAEQNAIVQAARFGIKLDGATIYCKMEPCYVCAMLIVNSGIKRVVCEKRYHAAKLSRGLFEKAGVKLDVLYDEIEQYTNQK